MNRQETISVLNKWDKKNKYVFTISMLSKLFNSESPKTFHEGLKRLVHAGILTHACRGIYVNENASSMDAYTLERIALLLRQGAYNYVSLESALSDYGMISQIMIDRLTVMTTGRKYLYNTTFGVIEFTHTKRTVSDILSNTYQIENRPLRIATQETALRDLKRVGRNLHLII